MTDLLTAIALGVVGPAGVITLVAVHFVTRAGGNSASRTYKSRPDLLQPEAAATTPVAPAAEHVGAQDDAATTQWLGRMRDLEEQTVALDRAALAELFRRQDREIGEEFVRDVEARLAAGFALIELEGASR